MPELQVNVDGLVRAVLIAGVGVLAFWLLRLGSRVAVDRMLARDAEAAEPSSLDVGALEREKRLRTVQGLTVRVGSAAIIIVFALMVLSTVVGVDIGPAIAGLGVVGIAVGFGAQTLIRDWLAGIFILVENQFSRGDTVSIGGVTGVVEEFSLRRTVLRDLDGVVHSVPNGTIGVASNLTRLWANVNLNVQISYESDLATAVEALDRLGADLSADEEWGPQIFEAPKVLRIEDLADSGVTLKIVGRVRPGQQWAVTGELRRRILERFGKARIEIPAES
jgi:small-conductance mechanosensitive channel